MKHLTFAEKSLLMGDDVADALLEYARILGESRGVDTVTVHALGVDGNEVDAALLLNPSAVMMVESTNSHVVPPENAEAVHYIQSRIDAIRRPIGAQLEPRPPAIDYDIAEIAGSD